MPRDTIEVNRRDKRPKARRPRVEPTFGPRPGAGGLRVADSDRATPSGRRPPRPPKRRSWFGRLVYWSVVLGVWGAVGLAAIVVFYASRLPPIDQLAVPKRPPNIAILFQNGTLIANRGDTGGAVVRIGDLPPYLPKAFVAIEDRRFYDHFGIDPIGIGRAIVRNLAHVGAVQGGSTLTQQLAKNLFLTQERTLSRKIQEAMMALWLEHKYSKDQILELYMNRVYFGSGAFGVEAAARRYFGHGARQVTLPEAAVLAGLMKAPTRYAPNRHPDLAEARAAQVIAALQDSGFITPEAAKAALATPAKSVHDQGFGNYAADAVMEQLDDTIGPVDADIVVSTTLDMAMQTAAEHAVSDELDRKGQKFGVGQGALVSLAPDGAIRALVGGRRYADSQFNRATAAMRQPGSSFKPFVYLTAIEHGLTPDTTREDAPINVKGWQPENASRHYLGAVPLTQALAMSLNTVAVRLGLELGPRAIAATAHRLGIGSDLQANASIALGTSEVTPLELVTAYAPFANGGFAVQPHIIATVKTEGGKVIYQRKGSNLGRVIQPAALAMMNSMMTETLRTGTARAAELPGWQAGGKTGTSQQYRDAWFVGYTGALITGVWMGNDDSSPTKKTSGSNLPVEVWSRFMREALRTFAPLPLPGGTAWREPPPPPPPVVAPAAASVAIDPRPMPPPARDPVVARAMPAPPSPPPGRSPLTSRDAGDGYAPPIPPGLIPSGRSRATF